MAVLTKAQVLTQARILYVDSDTTDPANSDTILGAIYDEKARQYLELVEPRYKRLSATASGLTLTGAYNATTSAVNIAEIVSAFYDASGASTVVGTEMERVPMGEIQQSLQELNFDVATGGNERPYRWNAVRVQTDTDADKGKWQFWLNQKHDNSAGATLFVILHARLDPTDTDPLDISEAGSYTLARIVAAEAARLIGEDQEFIAGILAPVREDILQKMNLVELAKRPRVFAGARVP